MRRAFAAAALVAAAVVAPVASAQDRDASVAAAVTATIQQHLRDRGLEASIPYVVSNIRRSLDENWKGPSNETNTWAALIHLYGRYNHWWPMAAFQGWPEELGPGDTYGGWAFDDGDFSDGSMPQHVGNKQCKELHFSVDEELNTLVPSVPLPTGGPMSPPMLTYYARTYNVTVWEFADSFGAAALWSMHRLNIGKAPVQWWGARSWQGGGNITMAKRAYRNELGQLVQADLGEALTAYENTRHWSPGNIGNGDGDFQPCPAGEGGNDFDFYSFDSDGNPNSFNTQDGCTYYEKNFSVSRSGYGVADEVPIPFGSVHWQNYFLSHADAGRCAISPELIMTLAQQIFYDMTQRSWWTGPGYEPFTIDQARTVGATPTGLSLLQTPFTTYGEQNSGVIEPTASDPPDGYTPPDYSGGGGDPGGNSYNVDLTHPEVPDGDWTTPEFGMPDWLPGIDGFEVPTGSGQCPIFGFEAFGSSYTMDTHCTVINDYAAAIASIMIVVFAMMSYAIVLKA